MLRFTISRSVGVVHTVQKRGVSDVVTRPKTGETFVRLGPGGRSSVSGHTATVFGATGFAARYVVNNLGKQGTNVVVPYRGLEDEKRHLKLMGDLGQIVPLRFHLNDDEQIAECVRHSDVVYNLMGRDHATKNFSLTDVHVDGARKLARISRENGVSKFIHVSCLNADVNSESEYYRTKALGEEAVREEFPDAIIVRPATMYGGEDRFWNRLGGFIKLNFIPIFNNGATLSRPVYVGDVAAALGRLMHDEEALGKTFELVGPKEYYSRSLIDFFLDVTGHKPRIVNFPKPIAKPLFKIFNAPQIQPLIPVEDIDRAYVDDQVTPGTLGFDYFNIKPHSVEETIIRFAPLYRGAEQQRNPYETVLKKYTTDHVRRPAAV